MGKNTYFILEATGFDFGFSENNEQTPKALLYSIRQHQVWANPLLFVLPFSIHIGIWSCHVSFILSLKMLSVMLHNQCYVLFQLASSSGPWFNFHLSLLTFDWSDSKNWASNLVPPVFHADSSFLWRLTEVNYIGFIYLLDIF